MQRYELSGSVLFVDENVFTVEMPGVAITLPYDPARGQDAPTVGNKVIVAVEVYSAGT